MKNNDTQLIHLTLDGDDSAFAELVEKYQKQVHALVWRKIGDFHIAEEITQDTFLKAYQKLGTLKKPQRFVSWLYVIASNRCKTWLDKKNTRKQLLEDKDIAQSDETTYSEYMLEENERITVETQRDVVKKLLAKLGESERTIMTLHYFGEMSCSEIGAFLGVSANTVKSRLRRAQQRLQKEETMIREALDNFKISPNLTETIMQEISRAKPTAPSGGKPIVPWAVAASTLVVVLFILGFGNSTYLTRFQKPYSFDATAEMTVDIIDAPIFANLEHKPDVRTEIGSANAQGKRINREQLNDVPAAVAEAQGGEIVEDYTKWKLPKAAKARLGKGGINVIKYSPDGTQLAVGSNIGVWLYDVNTGEGVPIFPGICQSLAFSPDGQFLASGRKSKKSMLWELATGREVALIDALPRATLLRFSEDGKTLLSLEGSGNSISQLDIETRKENKLRLEGVGGSIDQLETRKENGKKIITRIRTAPTVYALTYNKFAVGGQDGKIELWDTTGKKLSTLSGQEGKHVFALAFSPDGTRLASGSEDTTQLWNTARNDEPIILGKHLGWITVLAFSPDGKILATGSTDKTVQLWDTATGDLIKILTGHIDGINALTFSPDGVTLASASTDGTVMFWNIDTGAPLPTRITGHTRLIDAVAFVENSTTLASVAFNRVITLWDLKTSQKTEFQMNQVARKGQGYHQFPQDLFHALAFSPDGTKLVSIGREGEVIFFVGSGIARTKQRQDQLIQLTDVSTGRELYSLTWEKDYNSVVFSPDGKTIALSRNDRFRMWNTEIDISLSNPNNGDSVIKGLVFSSDGKKLVIGTVDGKVHVWDVQTGDPLEAVFAREEQVLTGEQEFNGTMAFSPNGNLLAMASNEQVCLVGIHEQIAFKEVYPSASTKTLVFSPDNAVLVIGLYGGIELWDMKTGDKLTAFDVPSGSVRTLVFSPDGKTLVSTGQDGTILLWDWDEVLKGLEQ